MLSYMPQLAARTIPQQQQVLERLSTAEVFFPVAVALIGALILLFGFKAYRAVVVFNCIAVGFWVGGMLGQEAKIATVAAIIGGVLLGAVSWPLMKYAVALCGGLVGALCGMVIWQYFEYPPDLAWAGGLVGLILLGMLSFLVFKMSIIVFSCIQGAAMVVLGISALAIRFTPSPWHTDVVKNLNEKPILVPLLVLSLATLGLIYQQQKHGLLGGDAGAGGGGAGPKPEGKK